MVGRSVQVPAGPECYALNNLLVNAQFCDADLGYLPVVSMGHEYVFRW